MTTTSSPDPLHGRALRAGDRWLVAVSLLVAAATHVPLVPEHLREAPYIGIAFVALVVACLALAGALVLHDSVLVWAAVVSVNALAVLAYVVTRTIGLPQVTDDIGNWLEPLSFPALASEVLAVVVGTSVLLRHLPARTRRARAAAAAPEYAARGA